MGDVTMILAPDELHAAIYRDDLVKNLREGSALAFAHGFSVHFRQIEPRPDLDVFMVAPKGPGHTVRAEYEKGGGVPALIAVQQDASGNAQDIGLSYASAIGAGAPASSKRVSAKNAKPICSASRRSSVAGLAP